MKLAIALCLVSSVAFGDQLAKGRKLANQKKYKEAIAAFEEGLKTAPDDPTLLGEAGFTAYLDKDYDKAETLTRKSLDRQATPGLRGATLYNLGMIREAKGDKPGAIAAYKESLAARPHRVVRAALAKLDPAAAAAADELVPALLAGPYKDLAAACAAIPKEDGANECNCTDDKPTEIAGAAAPFQKLQVLTQHCDAMSFGGHIAFFVGAKTAQGWFTYPVADGVDTMKCNTMAAFSAATSAGGTLRIPATVQGECASGHGDEIDSASWSETSVVVLGAGPSKHPSASQITTAHTEPEHAFSRVDFTLKLEWKSPTEFTLSGKVKGIDKPDLLGPHTLVFP